MRRLALGCLMMLALSACGGSAGEENVAASESELLDENLVNELLGANLPPEAYSPPTNEAAQNEQNAEPGGNGGGNSAD